MIEAKEKKGNIMWIKKRIESHYKKKNKQKGSRIKVRFLMSLKIINRQKYSTGQINKLRRQKICSQIVPQINV